VIDGIPVIDGIVHAYNWEPSNYANRHGKMIVDDLGGTFYATTVPGYRLPPTPQAFLRDWSINEIANISFLESYNDLAVYHVLPINAFKDGSCSLDKGIEAIQRWPDRFIVYAGIDPMQGQKALDDLDEQWERLDHPIGLKLYPNSWVGEQISGWFMNDPEIAFPVFEHARRLGIKIIAVHKALPMGPVEMSHYHTEDIDRAAMAFPDLQFEIVHGGMSFVEETAWQLARFRNVWVNLEVTSSLVTVRPAMLERILAQLISGGPSTLERIIWGTGAVAYHSRPLIEAFVRDFQFSETLLAEGLPELTLNLKAKIMGENYARLAGIDLDDRLTRIKGDQFDTDGGLAPPFSTTGAAGHAE